MQTKSTLPLLLLFVNTWCIAQNKSDEYRAKAESLTDNNEAALKYYNLSLDEALKSNDFVRAANVCIDISSVYHQEADYQTSLRYCWSSKNFLNNSKTKPDTVLFKINTSLGTMYKNINRKDSAYYYFGLADKLLEKNKKIVLIIPEYVQSHYNIQGRWLNSMGEFKNGTILIEKAFEIAKKNGLVEDENIALTNLSAVYQTLGMYDKALKYRLEALRKLTKNDLLKCYNLSGLGWVLKLNAQPQEGIHYLKKGISIYKQLQKSNNIKENFDLYTTLLYNTGICYFDLGEYTISEKYFLEIVSEFTTHRLTIGLNLSKSWVGLSEIQKNRGNVELSETYLQKALISGHTNFSSLNPAENPTIKGAINEKHLVNTLILKGRNEQILYQVKKKRTYLENASNALLRGIEIINELRGSYDNVESKLFLNEQIHSIYDLAIQTTFELYSSSKKKEYKENILKIVESSKASILSDVLHESMIKPRTIPYELLNREVKLKNDISKLKNVNTLDSAQQAKLRDLELKKYSLLRELEQVYPDYYLQKYGRRTYQSSDVQKQLNSEDFFISYYWNNDFLYIICIDKNKFEIIKQPIENKLFTSKLNQFKQIIYQNPGLSVYNGVETAAYLHSILFIPIQRWLTSKTRLIVCRDWKFNFLPFEVLESGKYFNDYLVKKYSFRYVYSGELLINQPKSDRNNTILGVAPFTQNKIYQNGLFKYLPESEAQVRKVSNNILIDNQASKNGFLKYYQDFGIIYLATHSVVSDTNPNESFIVFYPENDFKLSINEVYDLNLTNTNLVVLSSCEAGNGKIHQSEGTLSLARAFSYAGCKSILTTLWSTNDASSAYLTERFHHHLTRGESKDIALQKARLDFFDSDFGKKYNHPFFWGNFNLIGNSEPVFQNHPIRKYAISTVLLLLLVFSIFKLQIHKKEKQRLL